MNHWELFLDLERTCNYIEAGFWSSFGVVATLGLWRQARRLTPFSLIAGSVLILFGLSDLVEARTGAWWRPWWLLLWKAVCLTPTSKTQNQANVLSAKIGRTWLAAQKGRPKPDRLRAARYASVVVPKWLRHATIKDGRNSA